MGLFFWLISSLLVEEGHSGMEALQGLKLGQDFPSLGCLESLQTCPSMTSQMRQFSVGPFLVPHSLCLRNVKCLSLREVFLSPIHSVMWKSYFS